VPPKVTVLEVDFICRRRQEVRRLILFVGAGKRLCDFFHLYLTWRENILYNKTNSKKGALL
jgi:hypothetical protein